MAAAPRQRAQSGVPARPSVRLIAMLIDSAILFVPIWVFVLQGYLDRAGDGETATLSVGHQVLLNTVGIAYYVVTEGLLGATVGKALMGVRVVDAVTGRAPVGLLRAGWRYVSRLLTTAVCGLGYLSILGDRQRRTWYDRLSGTRVVH